MTEKNSAPEATEASKPSFRDRLKQSNIPAKAKNIAAVVGVVTVVGVVAAAVTKKKSVSLDATLPDLDVSIDA